MDSSRHGSQDLTGRPECSQMLADVQNMDKPDLIWHDRKWQALQGLQLIQHEPGEWSEDLTHFGEIICECVMESMKSTSRSYAYEVGEMTKCITPMGTQNAAKEFFWSMRAGFATQEEAVLYKKILEQREGKVYSIFINGVPVEGD